MSLKPSCDEVSALGNAMQGCGSDLRAYVAVACGSLIARMQARKEVR